MHTRWLTAALTLCALRTAAAQAPSDPRYQRAFATLYTTAQLGSVVKAWCDARAPLTRTATDTALAAWKSEHQIDDVEARADTVLGDQLPKIRAGVESRRATVFQALDRDSKNPDADCRQMLAYLNRAANPRRLYPAEFALLASRRAAAGTPAPAAQSQAPAEVRGSVSTVDQLRTAPNAGLAMADIDGIYQPTQLRYNPMSMLFEPDETTYLLLKDGWLYDGLDISPHDLDVAASRRLEPQHWHRWRRRGGVLEQQEYDEYGKTDGKWSTLELIARPPIGARRLNGTFASTSSATAGLAGGGGATVIGRTSFTFRPDGTFSWLNFTQGFGSSTVGTGPGGASIVVGGASVGPNGTSVSTVGGGEDQGTYTTDNYTLELRTKSGKVLRFPIFAWDDAKYRDYLVIDGTTYSPPK